MNACYLPHGRMTVQRVGLSDAVWDLLGQCFSKKPSDVKVCVFVLEHGTEFFFIIEILICV